MSFDLRLPIGLLFLAFGVVLAADGAIAHRLVLDINVNLWWGLVMIVFGALMLVFAMRAKPVASRPGSDDRAARHH